MYSTRTAAGRLVSQKLGPNEIKERRKNERRLPMAAFLLVGSKKNAMSQHPPPFCTFAQFGKSFQNSTCGTMGDGRNSKFKRYPVTKRMLVTARKQVPACLLACFA